MTIPGTALSWNGRPETEKRQAIQWVENNLKKIGGRAVKFKSYSPYDLEDFIQQAYVTALVAADISWKKNIPFEACFWILYTADCRSMASNTATRNCYQEFTEDYTDQGYAPTCPQDLSFISTKIADAKEEDPELIEALIDMALHVMTPKQREVWCYLLDDSHYSILEIARILEVGRQTIEEFRDTGLKRVRRYFEMSDFGISSGLDQDNLPTEPNR